MVNRVKFSNKLKESLILLSSPVVAGALNKDAEVRDLVTVQDDFGDRGSLGDLEHVPDPLARDEHVVLVPHDDDLLVVLDDLALGHLVEGLSFGEDHLLRLQELLDRHLFLDLVDVERAALHFGCHRDRVACFSFLWP